MNLLPNDSNDSAAPQTAVHTAALGALLVLGTAAGPSRAAARPQAAAPEPSSGPDSSAPTEPDRSYAIPAAEIVGFDTLLNLYDRSFLSSNAYDSNLSTIARNLHRGWVVEDNPYKINQFGHPYQGSIYHTLARSAGLSYWESAGYTFAGSVLWEIGGERSRPSKNDQIASGIAGSFLGEPLFRMANLVLSDAHGLSPFWREVCAALISPATGFNRFAFGDRFDHVFDDHDPAYYARLQLGTGATVQNTPGATTKLTPTEVLADFDLDYGLPGQTGYTYSRPFDYFNFQLIGSSATGIENISTRGLLLGKPYSAGDNYHGVWGLYGSFDYFEPQIFRLSSTALSLGSTAQWRLSRSVVLQGTGLAGLGFEAVRTSNTRQNAHDYHYGVGPQELVALRLILGNRASLAITGRDYYVTAVGGGQSGTRKGVENIARADVTLTVRLYRHQSISLKFLWSRRDAWDAAPGQQVQARGTFGLYYTLVGDPDLGVVAARH